MGGRQEAESRRRAQGHRGPSPAKGVRALGRCDRRDAGQCARREPRAAQALRRSGLSRSASEGIGESGRKPGNARGLAPARVSPLLLFSIGLVGPSSSAHSMGMQIARRGTTVLVLTSDAGLIRLARSILKPACTVIGRAPLGASANIRAEQADIVIIDAESVDHNVIATARRACPGAQVVALSREFSEADCVAILDADADYLARP